MSRRGKMLTTLRNGWAIAGNRLFVGIVCYFSLCWLLPKEKREKSCDAQQKHNTLAVVSSWMYTQACHDARNMPDTPALKFER